MRRIYLTQKYIKYNTRHARKLQHRKALHNRGHKIHNENSKNITKTERKHIHAGYKIVKARKNFTFLKNSQEVIKTISICRDHLKNHRKVFINLSDVEKVDNGSITLLMSLMAEFQLSGIKYNGNFPDNIEAKKSILSSGFFEYLWDRRKKTSRFDEESLFNKNYRNQIYENLGKTVKSESTMEICQSVSETLGKDKEQVPKGLSRVLIELMHNTNNHASIYHEGEEYWWLTAHHDKKNQRVCFIFLDLGVGIFSSLRSKTPDTDLYGIYERLKKLITGDNKTDEKMLKLILQGEIRKTITGKENRGKGLPSIYKAFERNQIDKLHIITNNVYANIKDDEYLLMDENFEGTFVYWEINNESEMEKWK